MADECSSISGNKRQRQQRMEAAALTIPLRGSKESLGERTFLPKAPHRHQLSSET